MPGWCIVPFCGKKCGGHLFPKNPQLRKKWKIAVRRHEEWEPSKYSTVCRMHFKEDDFVNDRNALQRKLKQHAVPSVFRWTMFRNTEKYEKQAKERSERARRRTVAKDSPDMFVDYIEQEYTALNEWEVSTEDVDLGSSPVLTTSLKTSSVAAQTDPVPKTSSAVSRANDKKNHKPPGSSQGGPDRMDTPQTGVQKVAPQQTSFAMRRGTVILQLNPATKFIPVTVDLPQLPPVQGSGQKCRQPVLQSSGPASSERLGPQPCLSACGPYPVMLIGPRQKRLLAQMYPVKARSPEEGECQSSLQVTQASQECAAVPVKVKLEEAEDSAASRHGEREVRQTPQDFAVSVKMEPLEEDGDTRCFEKREVDRTPQDFAVSVKMEPWEEDGDARCFEKGEVDRTPQDFAVSVKREPLEEDGDARCFEKREINRTPQDFAVSVKMEPWEEDGDTRCFEKGEINRTPQDFAVSVKMEPLEEDGDARCFEKREINRTPQDFAVSVKMEPLEEDGDTRCFEKGDMDRTPQDFAVLPVEVKVEEDMGYSDTLVQVKTEPLDN